MLYEINQDMFDTKIIYWAEFSVSFHFMFKNRVPMENQFYAEQFQ